MPSGSQQAKIWAEICHSAPERHIMSEGNARKARERKRTHSSLNELTLSRNPSLTADTAHPKRVKGDDPVGGEAVDNYGPALDSSSQRARAAHQLRTLGPETARQDALILFPLPVRQGEGLSRSDRGSRVKAREPSREKLLVLYLLARNMPPVLSHAEPCCADAAIYPAIAKCRAPAGYSVKTMQTAASSCSRTPASQCPVRREQRTVLPLCWRCIRR